MYVRVILKCGLEKILQKDVVVCEINAGAKVTDLLQHICFPAERAGIVLVDGKKKCMNSLLYGGEVIKVYPENFNTIPV